MILSENLCNISVYLLYLKVTYAFGQVYPETDRKEKSSTFKEREGERSK